MLVDLVCFFFSSRRRHTRSDRDWSSDVCSSDLRVLLAKWLTAAENPFFAKSVANRVWFHLLGRGIVDPVDDFRESNPSANRSEERRVGKECRSRWSPYH